MPYTPPAPLDTPATTEGNARQGARGTEPRSEPPKWMLERVFERLAVGPTAVGSMLDRGAKLPVIGLIIRFFSTIVLGLLWLLLVAVYVAVGSGLANVRAYFEMTDMEFFNAWPMVVLLILLATTLTVVTLRRIRLSIFKAGVWTVHVGILTLITGCFIYFSQKYEGLVRIQLHESVTHYYDSTERALYAYRMDDAGKPIDKDHAMTRLPKLPIYFEHIPENNTALNRDVPVALLPRAQVRILGYYPAAELREGWTIAPAGVGTATEGVGAANPAIRVGLTMAGEEGGQMLLANSPKGRTLDQDKAPFGIEYLRNPSAERLADIAREVPGPVAITVRVPGLGIEKTFAAETNKRVVIEGTPYTLTPKDQMALPLVSKGYEGAFSNALSIDVARAGPATQAKAGGATAATQPAALKFTRMAMFRYPELSPDFVNENGQQKRIQARVDHDLEIVFHDAQRDQFWFVQTGSDDKPTFELIHRLRGGKVERRGVEAGKPLQVQVGPVPLRLGLQQYTPNAVLSSVAEIIPTNRRQQTSTVDAIIQTSLIRLQVTQGDWSRSDIYVPFVQFASTAPPPFGRVPTTVDIPGVGRIGFVFSTTRRDLPSVLKLTDFQAIKYPGAVQNYADYVSTLEVTDKRTGEIEQIVARLNNPAANHGLYYFQAAWDGDQLPGVRFTVLGVGNRPGITTMTVGSILIIIGIAYAFYVKPILLRLKKEQVAAWAKI